MAVNRTQKSRVRKINSMKPAELQDFIKHLEKAGGKNSKVYAHAVKRLTIN